MAETPKDSAGEGALVVGLTAFAAYGLTCASSPYLLDSAELAHAAFGLGIPHPPGEPLATLWGKIFTFIPVGSIAFRVGLSQAASGAVAVGLVYALALRLLPWLNPRLGRGARVTLAAAGALAFALAPGVVNVSNRPEVYALQTALSLAALLLALRGWAAAGQGEPRCLLLAALLLGLGMGNHPLIAGLVGVAAAAAALPQLRASALRLRLILAGVGAFTTGLLVIAYVPIRAAALYAGGASDAIVWGDARSVPGLKWVLTAKTFADKAPFVHRNARPTDLPFMLIEELQIIVALASVAGLYFLIRRPETRGFAGLVMLAWTGSVAAAMVGGLDPGNPDIRGYLGVAIALTAVLAVCAAAGALHALPGSWTPFAVGGLWLLAALARFPLGGDYPNLRRADAAAFTTRRLLADLPVRSAYLSGYFQTGFLVGYHRQVEGLRSDIAWAHLGFARNPGYATLASARAPELGALLQAWGEKDVLSATAALAARRPVRFEADSHLPALLRARLHPSGKTWVWDSPAGSALSSNAWELPDWVLAEASLDPQLRGFLAFQVFQDASLACGRGLTERARGDFSLLFRLAPLDREARALAARCLR